MRLSLSARILQGGAPPMTCAQFIDLARQTGFDLVELRSGQVSPETSDAELADIAQALRDAKIGVSMLVVDDLGRLGAWARVARALGAGLLRGGGTVEALRAAAARLPADLRLAAQMHSQSPFEDVPQAAAALATIPDRRFGVMPEPANLLFTGARWSADLFGPIAARIYGCNAQSIALDPSAETKVTMNDGRQVPYSRLAWPANHELRFAQFVAALRAAGYDGFINFIDPFLPGMTVQQLAASTAAFARLCL